MSSNGPGSRHCPFNFKPGTAGWETAQGGEGPGGDKLISDKECASAGQARESAGVTLSLNLVLSHLIPSPSTVSAMSLICTVIAQWLVNDERCT